MSNKRNNKNNVANLEAEQTPVVEESGSDVLELEFLNRYLDQSQEFTETRKDQRDYATGQSSTTMQRHSAEKSEYFIVRYMDKTTFTTPAGELYTGKVYAVGFAWFTRAQRFTKALGFYMLDSENRVIRVRPERATTVDEITNLKSAITEWNRHSRQEMGKVDGQYVYNPAAGLILKRGLKPTVLGVNHLSENSRNGSDVALQAYLETKSATMRDSNTGEMVIVPYIRINRG